MNIVEAICVVVPISILVGVAATVGVLKLPKRERKAPPPATAIIVYDAEPYPRAWE
ncbi:hypothetical protein [Paraburkholderia sp. J12]|uniref:hypothetical protein n=1 Tax=Paraburkholderia sp. J12 TaxID=2805432 RepID=UPI002ABDEC1B|nr:hypothetical protein [Paraburkholderia sp. J12]